MISVMRKRVLQRIIKEAGGQKELAAKVGVSKQTVSWWVQNGVPAKRVGKVIAVARFLGLEVHKHQLRPDYWEPPASGVQA
jgi:DNA-binding transcriptional regulator YdaS (Cro superfamily)